MVPDADDIIVSAVAVPCLTASVVGNKLLFLVDKVNSPVPKEVHTPETQAHFMCVITEVYKCMHCSETKEDRTVVLL